MRNKKLNINKLIIIKKIIPIMPSKLLMIKPSIILMLLVLLVSCESEIDIDTGDFMEKPVIEGYIENGSNPWVIITKNQYFFTEFKTNFSDTANLINFLDFLVLNAEVTVSDGIFTDTLKFEVDPQVLTGDFIYPPVKYTTKNIVGEVGKTYTLKVKIDDNIYTSSTTITNPFYPDTVWYETVPDNDTLGYIHALITDDPNETNYYGYFTQRVGKDITYIPGYMSIWDDSYFNGKQFEVMVYRGYNPVLLSLDYEEPPEERWRFIKGDTVNFKIVTMDEDSFRFWHTLGGLYTDNNIDGGALGVWCGYGATYILNYVCE